MSYRVNLHRETLGVTQLALMAMRNQLAEKFMHHICVIEVPADQGCSGCYGFFIVDSDTETVDIIGDGFCADGGGEGGAGHRAVQALLSIYGITPEQAMQEEAINFVDDENAYYAHLSSFIEIAEAQGFIKLYEQKPRYPDWIFANR